VFVQSNSLAAVNTYFQNKLSAEFSSSEIRFMFRELAILRLHLTKEQLMFPTDVLLSESDLLFFRSSAHKLLEKIPFQHICGYTYFGDLKIQCNSDALIPRPETVELADWIASYSPKNVLDICTGTGCIALYIKDKLETCNLIALDISEDALKLAKLNALSLNLEVHFQQHDVLNQPLSRCIEAENCDVIVSNPPYIPQKEKQEMADQVILHEPHIALFVSDDDPLIFYKQISTEALNALLPGGNLFFEIHESFGMEMQKLLDEMGYINIELRKDLQGKDRMIKGQKPKFA
jgi:release factor glutamine methyltransferase